MNYKNDTWCSYQIWALFTVSESQWLTYSKTKNVIITINIENEFPLSVLKYKTAIYLFLQEFFVCVWVDEFFFLVSFHSKQS